MPGSGWQAVSARAAIDVSRDDLLATLSGPSCTLAVALISAHSLRQSRQLRHDVVGKTTLYLGPTPSLRCNTAHRSVQAYPQGVCATVVMTCSGRASLFKDRMSC